MVLNNLWFDFRGGVESERARLHNRRDVLAFKAPAHGSCRAAASLSGLGQFVVDARHAVDILRVLAIPDHLVRQFTGRDNLVRGPQTWWVGSNCAGNRNFAIRFSVYDAVVARREEEFRKVGNTGR